MSLVPLSFYLSVELLAPVTRQDINIIKEIDVSNSKIKINQMADDTLCHGSDKKSIKVLAKNLMIWTNIRFKIE